MIELVISSHIELLTGEIVLVRAPSLDKSLLINEYYRIFKRLTDGRPAWSENPDAHHNLMLQFYSDFEIHFKALSEMLRPGLSDDCDRMTPASRHHFFVANDPTTDINGKTMLGLSEVERLLGFSIKNLSLDQLETDAAAEARDEIEIVTTGNHLLDLKVDIFLMFEDRAQYLVEHHSPSELSNMLHYADYRMRPAEDKFDDDSTQAYIPVDLPTESEALSKHRDEISSELSQYGLEMPD